MASPLLRRKIHNAAVRMSHDEELLNMGIDCSTLQCNGGSRMGRFTRQSNKYEIKVVLLGKAYGGKTCLFHRFLTEKFDGELKPYQATIGAAYGSKTVSVDDKSVTLAVWDTGGCERFDSISRLYYRGAQAAILCYDVTDAASFERVKFWVEELTNQEPDCYLYLCGTKADLLKEPYCLERQHRLKDLIRYAESILAVGTYETSSRSGEGVEDLFQAVAKDFLQTLEEEAAESDSDKSSSNSGVHSNGFMSASGRVTLFHNSEDRSHHTKCQGCG